MKRQNAWLAVFLALTLAASAGLSGCGRRQKQPDESSSSSSSSAREEPDERQEPDPDDEDDGDEDESNSRDDEDDSSREDKDSETDNKDSGGEKKPSAGGNGSAGTGVKIDPSSSSQAPSVNQTTARPSSPSSKADAEVPSRDASSNSGSSSSRDSSSKKDREDYEALAEDITYREAGAYSTKATYQNGVIRGDGITLRNKTFNGDLTITSAAGDGDISLENVTVRGKLSIAGCGGWVKLYDTDIDTLELDKKGAQVFASQGTDVRSVAVKKDATLQEGTLSGRSGGFENITVAGPTNARTDLDLQGIAVDRVTTETQSWITVDSDSSVERLYAEAPTYVRGSGEVGQLTASNDYVYYQSRPARVSTDSGVRSPRKYDSKNNYWKGGDREDKDDDLNDIVTNRKEVYIRWVDAVNNITLTDGQSKTIRLETNAKTLKASSSNAHVLGVTVDEDQNLVLKARGVGNVKVTVTGSRSGYTSETRTFWVTAESTASQKPVIGAPGCSVTGWTNADVVVSFTVTDDDLESVTVPQRTVQKLSGDRYQFSVPANGTYTITARDKSGNSVTRDAVVKNIDKTAPQMKLVSNPPLSGSSVLVSFEVSDAGGSGFQWDSLRVSGVDAKDVTRSGAVCSFYAKAAGTYTVTGQDNAGNALRQEITVSPVAVDPSISIENVSITPASGWTRSKVVSFNVKSALPAAVSVSLAGQNIPASLSSFTAEAIGVYTITAANGSKTVSIPVDVKEIDTTPPSLSAELVLDPVDKTKRSLKITASDAESGLGKVLVNGTPVENFASPHIYEVDAAGSFTITACDLAGNETSAPTVFVPPLTLQETDKTAPEITITSPEGWAKEKIVDITVSDSESGVKEAAVSVDGVPAQTQSVLRDSNQQRFTYTVRKDSVVTVSAVDGAGNTVTKEESVTGIDAIPPKIDAAVSGAGTWTTEKTLTVSATDEGGSGFSLTVDGVTVNSGFSQVYTQAKEIVIVAVDGAGNRTEQTVTIDKIDTTLPAAPTLQYTAVNEAGQKQNYLLPVYSPLSSAQLPSFKNSQVLTLLPPQAEANGSPETTTYQTAVVFSAGNVPIPYGDPVSAAAAVPLTLTAQNNLDTIHCIRVQTTDEAGNVTTTEYRITITVPKPTAPTTPSTPTTPGTTTPDPGAAPSDPPTTPDAGTAPTEPPASETTSSETTPPAGEPASGGTENKAGTPSPAPEGTETENQ